MFYLVYQITNLTNGKTYIGAHKTDNKDDGYMGSGTILKRAVKKHGLENFKKEILFEATSAEEMFTKEKELVVLGPQSYNLKEGGHGGWDHLSKEFRAQQFTKEERYNQGVLGIKARIIKYGEGGHKASCVAAAKKGNSQRTQEEQKGYGKKGGLTTASRRTAEERIRWAKHASRSVSPELYIKQAQLFSLRYRIIYPNGTIEEICNLRNYCRKHRLNQGGMSSVASGKKKHHMGITIERLDVSI